MAMIPESLACEMSRNCNTRNNRETQKRTLVRFVATRLEARSRGHIVLLTKERDFNKQLVYAPLGFV
jgi:hypothetical protein